MTSITIPSFQERYTHALATLTPTERKIGEYLMRHPDDVIDASAVQIAAASGTSDATVIRTIQGLGYAGLRELKKEFLQDVLRRRSMAASLDHNIDRLLADERPTMRMLADSVGTLEAFRQEFDEGSFDQAVAVLSRSSRIYAFGLGPGSLVAAFFALHLNRTGRDAHAIMQTGYRLADELLPLRAEHCVVLFATYHQTIEVEAVVDHARDVGAPVILITEALAVSLRDRVDVTVRTPQTISNLASESLVPLTVGYALAMALASRDKATSVETNELFNRLSSRFTGSLEMPSPPFLSEGPTLV